MFNMALIEKECKQYNNGLVISMSNLLKMLINMLIIISIFTLYSAIYPSKKTGCMVLVEGLDLSRKSTITKALVNNLQKSGYDSVSYSHNMLVPNRNRCFVFS